MILDLIVIGLLVLSFVVSAKRGLIRSVWKIAALIVTIVLVTALKTPAVEFLAKTSVADTVYDFVSEKLTVEIENPNEDTGIPKFMLDGINDNQVYDKIEDSINRGTDAASRRLTAWALNVIASVALFLIIRVLLSALFVILNGASKLPVIHTANAFLGGLLGAVNTLAAIYIACAALSLFAAESEVYALIDSSILVKYLYNYNILLQIIT